MLTYRIFEEKLLHFDPVSKGPVPTLYDPDGIYPYESYVGIANRPRHQAYTMVELANDCLTAVFCPDLGGKLFH